VLVKVASANSKAIDAKGVVFPARSDTKMAGDANERRLLEREKGQDLSERRGAMDAAMETVLMARSFQGQRMRTRAAAEGGVAFVTTRSVMVL
jgi:predicted chitinase